jgi:hypothetical protein
LSDRRPSFTPITGATVHFHVDDQLFDLIVPSGFIQPDQPAAQHGHAHTDHLPGTEVPVGGGRTLQ